MDLPLHHGRWGRGCLTPVDPDESGVVTPSHTVYSVPNRKDPGDPKG